MNKIKSEYINLKKHILNDQFKKKNESKLEKTEKNIKIVKKYSNIPVIFKDTITKINNKEINEFISLMNQENIDLNKFYNNIFNKKKKFEIIFNGENCYNYIQNKIYIESEEMYSTYIYHELYKVLTNGFQFKNSFIALNEGMTQLLTSENFVNKNIYEYEVSTVNILKKIYEYDELKKIYYDENPKNLINLLSLYLDDNEIINFINSTDNFSKILHSNKNRNMFYLKKYNEIICKILSKLIINKYDELELDQIIELIKDEYPELLYKINYFHDSDKINLFTYLYDIYNVNYIKTLNDNKEEELILKMINYN